MSDADGCSETVTRDAPDPAVRAVVTAEIAHWVADGLLSPRLGQRLLAECEPTSRPKAALPVEERWPQVRIPLTPGMVLLYLGGLLVFCAACILLGQAWDDLGAGGRFAILFAPTAALYAAGISTRRPGGDPTVSNVLLFFGGAILPFAVALAAQCPGGPDGDVALWLSAVASLVALAANIATLAAFRSPVLTLPYVGTGIWAAFAVTQWLAGGVLGSEESAAAFIVGGCALLAVGVVERRRGHPAFAFAPDLVGAVSLLLGMLVLQGPHNAVAEAASVLVCLAMMVASVPPRSQTYLLCSAAALMLNVFFVGFEHFGETIGAPAALIVCGGLCIGTGFLVQRVRRAQASAPT